MNSLLQGGLGRAFGEELLGEGMLELRVLKRRRRDQKTECGTGDRLKAIEVLCWVQHQEETLPHQGPSHQHGQGKAVAIYSRWYQARNWSATGVHHYITSHIH